MGFFQIFRPRNTDLPPAPIWTTTVTVTPSPQQMEASQARVVYGTPNDRIQFGSYRGYVLDPETSDGMYRAALEYKSARHDFQRVDEFVEFSTKQAAVAYLNRTLDQIEANKAPQPPKRNYV